MDELIGWIAGIVLVIVAICFIIYILSLVASIIAVCSGIGGALWGGGTAIRNYAKAFKDNMISSNKKTVVA